jgi:hypothetical protein
MEHPNAFPICRDMSARWRSEKKLRRIRYMQALGVLLS